MIEYIYFVKCPNCEDEPFEFFDKAKEFALGCLSQNPIITQTEVNRNDFGECTDSCDLGTVWSWEDLIAEPDTEPVASVFTQGHFAEYNPDNDAEFDSIDNSVDFEPETSEISAIDEIPDNFRKPIPEGMTIEQLVEEMEKNEDEVECTWCNELFDKDQCRYEVDLGWLCGRCEAAIKSRGETLTFRENNYWDFLDEETLKEAVDISDISISDISTEDFFDALTAAKNEFGTNCKVTIDEINNFIVNWVASSKKRELAEENYKRDPFDHHDPDYDEDELANLVASQIDDSKDAKYDRALDFENADRLENLEEAADYRDHLTLCPECGADQGFDKDTGFCIECGFNFEGI